MTTVAFGGGPTVEQRRNFAGLQEGSQVPGYRGYCPQIKYRVGKTYGQDTHELSQEYPFKQTIPSVLPEVTRSAPSNIPQSTGDNKYTNNMVPGYTGYVPRMPFKFGNTYKEDCDWCIGQHMGNMTKYDEKAADLFRASKAFPKLNPISGDPKVRDHLNTYRDTHPQRTLFMEDKRRGTEPPIPGYYGYVPRIYTTEQGLGCRYHQMTKNGLTLFDGEQNNHKAVQRTPITIDREPTGPALSYTGRVYLNDGMIPKYTGYVPQRRFNFGNTYGDTTRSLEVCAHNKDSFGDFMKTKPVGITKSLA